MIFLGSSETMMWVDIIVLGLKYDFQLFLKISLKFVNML